MAGFELAIFGYHVFMYKTNALTTWPHRQRVRQEQTFIMFILEKGSLDWEMGSEKSGPFELLGHFFGYGNRCGQVIGETLVPFCSKDASLMLRSIHPLSTL